tara:strand:- start:3013 stop:3693 length:681 start_codon:yes stop_codon:yes gene_type:complete
MAGLIQFNDKDKPKTSRVIKTAPEDIWLNKMVDDYLTGTMTSPRSGVFHPSTLSNKCDRAVWLIYNGQMPETELDPKLNRIFQNGNYLEKRIESWFKNLGILMGSEVPVKHINPEMSGRIDFLIRHEEHGIVPVELKSINSAGFGKLRTAREDHETQLQIYLNIGKYDIGTVFYENKDNQKIKTFLVKRDLKRWDDILTRCFNIQNMATPPTKCTGLVWCACKKVK